MVWACLTSRRSLVRSRYRPHHEAPGNGGLFSCSRVDRQGRNRPDVVRCREYGFRAPQQLSPRFAVLLMWIFTPWVDRAFGPIIWPILGILFLPLTTLLYVILWNTGGRGSPAGSGSS